ncbi:hypothetical protein PCC8801_2608 [Rippkaea orientalis PCC 8801]|uniref:DUF642 domain-containing protein n=1 Tax=Rippkaea orientalis (strain PCC 8801 / RF-1) TaxID=41431 RepID=B7K4V6_RIPO1|nr:hypothetical protein [Rippkaea orientalis]ACK66612.1 hypothetical protein PCC8801_2608 [Rippkaea orientalis PCC 8801]
MSNQLIPVICGLLSCAIIAENAQAANLIINGGFETGTLSGWNTAGVVQATLVNPPCCNFGGIGSYIAGFNAGDLSPNGILSQSYNTIIGASYRLQFDYGTFSNASVSQSIFIELDGAAGISSVLNTSILLKVSIFPVKIVL